MLAKPHAPVTLGHIRGHGCRRLLVYCASTWCNHRANLDADWLPDETVIRALCPRMVCTACGLIGANARLDWTPMTLSGLKSCRAFCHA